MSSRPTLEAIAATRRWTPGPAAPPRPVTREAEPERLRLRPGSLVPGTRLCVEGWLGEGATAVVYRGLHVDLGRPLAIKVLREPDPSPATRERFLTEARLTSEIDSEFVVDVIDFGRLEDGRLYYAMGFLDGRPLDELVDGRPLPVARAVALLRMACKGLQAAHDRGVVHRDVKPANLMVVQRRHRERLVVVDFGIATTMGHTPLDVRGTPHTMAPEQIGCGMVDARTDVYALGCCAFHMLTGKPAIGGETVPAVLAAHLDEARPRIGPEHGVPRPIAEVVHRCLALDPAQRYASARELEAALCEAQIAAGTEGAGEHLEPPDVEEPRRSRIAAALARSRRRVRARSAVLVGLLALAAALLLGTLVQRRISAAARDRAGVEAMVAAARDAAARSRFVYPPPRQQHATAYQHLTGLEHWNGPARAFAEEQATALRSELGQLLLALGDERWDRPGEQGHARDYYAQALIFDPSLERARARVGMTPGELAELRHKASTDTFSEVELENAAELVEPSEEEQQAARVAEAARVRARERERVKEERRREKTVAMVPPPPPATRRDPAKARRLVRTANRAKRRGDRGRAEALYLDALQLDDHNADAYGGLSELSTAAGKDVRALRMAKLAVRRAPGVARHRLRLGEAYRRLERKDEAMAELRRAAKLGSLKARRELGELERG